MQFGSTNTNIQQEVTRDKVDNLNRTDNINTSENAFEMEFSESPHSSTSMEMAEFSMPSTQSNDDDNDDAASSDESEVNLPPGACNFSIFFLFFNSTFSCEQFRAFFWK